MGAAEDALRRQNAVESAAAQRAELREDHAMLSNAEQIHDLAHKALGAWAITDYAGGELVMRSEIEPRRFGKTALHESEVAGLKIATWGKAAGLADLRDDPDYYFLSTGEIARGIYVPQRDYRHSRQCEGDTAMTHVRVIDLRTSTWGGSHNEKSSRKRALEFMLAGMTELAQS